METWEARVLLMSAGSRLFSSEWRKLNPGGPPFKAVGADILEALRIIKRAELELQGLGAAEIDELEARVL